MGLAELNRRIVILRSELDALRPLNPQQERRIVDKYLGNKVIEDIEFQINR